MGRGPVSRARFEQVCPRCTEFINVGQEIKLDMVRNVWRHVSCRRYRPDSDDEMRTSVCQFCALAERRARGEAVTLDQIKRLIVKTRVRKLCPEHLAAAEEGRLSVTWLGGGDLTGRAS